MNHRPIRILCADDNELLGDVMLCLLSQQGFWVEYAEDGIKAFERAVASEFDVLITDHEMPRCAGLELVKLVRKTEKPIRVIVHSSSLSDDLTQSYRELGVTTFVPKGCRPEALLNAVKSAA